MKYLILFILFSQSAFALSPLDLSYEERNPETEDVLIKRPEKFLRNESLMYDLNTDLGIRDQRKYTGKDKNRFAVAGHVSGDYERINYILGLEFNYMRRTEKYNQIWYGVQLFQHRTFFNAITQNQVAQTSDNPNDESKYQRPNNSLNHLSGMGAGVGYRFKLLTEFYPTEDVFETVDVFTNYLTMDETYIDQKYTGYGLSTNYGIHKRTSTKYFYGGKASYNIGYVTRDAIGTESKGDRSFSIGWFSLAFEMGIFY